MPQQQYLWSASDRFARHQRRYRRSELRAELRRAGFAIERITSFNSLLLRLLILSRMRQKHQGEAKPWRELEMSAAANKKDRFY